MNLIFIIESICNSLEKIADYNRFLFKASFSAEIIYYK